MIASVRSSHLPIISIILSVTLIWSPVLYAQTDTMRIATAVVTESSVRNVDMVPVQRMAGTVLQTLRAHSVADALRYFSGVQLKDYGGMGGLKTVNVRGMGTQHVGVVLDGVALVNSQNGTIDLGRFSLEEMERITLYNGQRTTLLQPAANFSSASAVFLESRTPDFDVYSHQSVQRLRTTLRAGSYATLQSAISMDVRVAQNLAATFAAGYLHNDGNYRFRYRVSGAYDTTGIRRNSDIDALRIEGGLYGKTRRDEWRVRAYLYASGRGLPGAVVRGRSMSGDRQWDTDLFLQSTWHREFTVKHTMLNTAKLAYDRLRFTSDPLRDPSTMYADNIYRSVSLYLSSAHKVTLQHVSFAAAADYRVERMLANLHNFATPTRHTALLSLAACTQWGRLRVQGNLLGTLVYDHTHIGESMRHRSELSPSLAIFYQHTDTSPLMFRAFAKRIFRMPTLCDLYYTFVGSSDLRPERTIQFDVGITWLLRKHGVFRGGKLIADVYHNTVRDKIVAIPGASMFRWTMLNLGRVSIQGVELGAQTAWRFGLVQIDLRATYTYERARDVTDSSDAFYGDQIPYIPRHSGSAVVRIGWQGWTARYSFLYTGQRYDQRANTPENFAPAWYTSDCALSYTWQHWEFTAELNNLFQQRYEIIKGYPLPGRNFLLGLTWRM